MLSVLHVENVQQCLRGVAAVVNVQQRRDASFPAQVVAWLLGAESVLEDARLPAVGQLAALRSSLLAAQHGARRSEGAQTGSRRKQLELTASDVLHRAQQALSEAIRTRVEQLAEAEMLASRVAAVARIKGVLAQAQTIEDHGAALNLIVQSLEQDADTAAATVHLTGIVGATDARILIDRALPELS